MSAEANSGERFLRERALPHRLPRGVVGRAHGAQAQERRRLGGAAAALGLGGARVALVAPLGGRAAHRCGRVGVCHQLGHAVLAQGLHPRAGATPTVGPPSAAQAEGGGQPRGTDGGHRGHIPRPVSADQHLRRKRPPAALHHPQPQLRATLHQSEGQSAAPQDGPVWPSRPLLLGRARGQAPAGDAQRARPACERGAANEPQSGGEAGRGGRARPAEVGQGAAAAARERSRQHEDAHRERCLRGARRRGGRGDAPALVR
mmetsp:Transcript_43316/g.105208  ORF Transcript_43316/g.105208 Transcript_43316/m.105208 type:complete len:260 (+) Transcript_43316:837-1616(+)